MNHSSSCLLPPRFLTLFHTTSPPSLCLQLSWLSLVASLLGFASFICFHRCTQQHSLDPKTWPFFGSHPELLTNFHRFHDWLLTYFSDHHRTIRLKVFSRRHYLTVDPTNVEHILKTNFGNYPKGDGIRSRLYDFLGDGIFNADGDIWKKHRKIASLEFSNRKLRDLSTQAFREDAVRLAGILDTAAKLHHSVDLHDLFMRMTLDSICKVGFGVDLGSLSPSLPDVPFARAFDTVNGIIAKRLVNPFWQLQRVLNLGTEKVLKQEMVTLNSFTSEVVRKRKEEIKATHDLGLKNEIREDLLSRFIKFNIGQAGGYSDQELRDSILNFVIAGRDTTAITLSWFIYCVCKKSEVGEKVFEETKRVLGLESSAQYSFREVADRITYESLSGMHYLHAALTETLRLYPAVPRDGKTVLDDDILPDGTQVKRGDQVSYIPYSMGRMEFLWGKDALEYNPDRWLEDGVFQPQSPFKFSAFQAGPRICLGKDSAYLQMKTTAALLLYFFKFSVVPMHVVQYRLMMVLAMAQGLLVHISHR